MKQVSKGTSEVPAHKCTQSGKPAGGPLVVCVIEKLRCDCNKWDGDSLCVWRAVVDWCLDTDSLGMGNRETEMGLPVH